MTRRWLWCSFLLLLLASGAFALTATPVFVQTPKTIIVTFVQGTDVAGTYKTVYTGDTSGSKVVGLYCTSNDTALSHLVTVQMSTSTAAHCSPQSNCMGGAAVTVPINAGFATGVPAVNMLAPANWPGLPVDSDGNPFLFLQGNTQTIEVTFATGLTTSTQVACVAYGASF